MKLNYISTKLFLFALLFGAAAGLCFFRAEAIYRTALDVHLRRELRLSGAPPRRFDEWHFAAFVNLCFAAGFAIVGYNARRSED